ncbi:septal ring lytic transglycosylase RlpA family protein [Ferrimonas pelagia]|uniref:Endolytic peptidoglycan transglycosylase RlpA n=1 Tax=Ferrimonas pelagia TaxID=1177826 RepID=A0ABP9F1D8_9GAMM
MKPRSLLSGTILTLLLVGCTSAPPQGRYQMHQDAAPKQAPDLAHLEPPTPRYEPHSRGGNRDYQVRGIHYQVLDSAEGYRQEGIASWYGAKFHGHLTSNGEIYDMYSFSAAHRSLPLPTYAKITNLDNDKSLIVRINDRGPFHPDREIDLSYAAAWHLDMLDAGTARVRVDAIHLQPQPDPLEPDASLYIQVAASSNATQVQQLQSELTQQYSLPARVTQQDSLYKLQLGPFETVHLAQQWLDRLQQAGFSEAFRVSDSPTVN